MQIYMKQTGSSIRHGLVWGASAALAGPGSHKTQNPNLFQARLLSSISMLAGIFVAIAAVIFSTYFDQLVVLRRDLGHFVTDNESMHSAASKVMAVSLNGLSLTVVSFTIVFLFHGVGGGLYCGTVLFR